MTRELHILVVGASLAGTRAAESLRREGFDGRITLVGAEAHFPPYDRPPLSKRLLRSASDAETVRLPAAVELDAAMLLGRTARRLDAAARTVLLDDELVLDYDGLVIATGSRVRRFPGLRSNLDGVFTLRTVEDALRLRAALTPGVRVAVVGAGFLGAEVTATCRELGLAVTLVDVFPQPMLRAVGPRMGDVLRTLHARHGVTLRLGRAVAAVNRTGPRVTGLTLDTGEVVGADVVVVAVGAVPETSWLDGSGLDVVDGVRCDERCFAVGAENVVAAGDVARWRHPLLGQDVRVEHWTNAVAQAQVAARNLHARLRGRAAPAVYDVLPYFWSDQYDWKLQFVGVPGDEIAVVDVDAEGERFVATYESGGRLTGALCVNCPAQVPRYRRRIVESLTGTSRRSA